MAGCGRTMEHVVIERERIAIESMQGAWSHTCVHITGGKLIVYGSCFCVFLYSYWDFCAVALSTLLSEARNKLFEHCGHLSLSVLQ